jgi:PhzF family phenazine biosynthesis protein
MANRRFKQVDVFTNLPFKGNPVAVVLHADGMSTEQMQQVANWTNLSETTFVVGVTEAGADYHVRIFTPQAELPFAGHPTIGTAHALLEAGLIEAKDGALVQQCRAGLVKLEVTKDQHDAQWIAFALPEPAITPLDAAEVDALEQVLGVPVARQFPPCLVDVGPRWVVAQLQHARDVLAARPDLVRMKAHDLQANYTGVVIFGEQDAGGPAGALAAGPAAKIEIRAFAPAHGIEEDPVCGSGTGCVGAFIRHSGQIPHFGGQFLATQGAVLGRAGVLKLALSAQTIQVGGNAVTCVDGTIAV